MSYLNITLIYFILAMLFVGCSDNSEKEFETTKTVNNVETSEIQPDAETNSEPVSLLGHYHVFGYFDEKNNLVKIDRYLNGELISN